MYHIIVVYMPFGQTAILIFFLIFIMHIHKYFYNLLFFYSEAKICILNPDKNADHDSTLFVYLGGTNKK